MAPADHGFVGALEFARLAHQPKVRNSHLQPTHPVSLPECGIIGHVTAAPFEIAEPLTHEVTETDKPWACIVWDDPVNLMSYVTYVFMTYFHYSKEKSQQLMLKVHNEGKTAVNSGTLEEMERDVAAMHSYGLWATMERDS